MFTGLVEDLGTMVKRIDQAPGCRITVRASDLGQRNETKIGDSIAVNGCCLTAVEIEGKLLTFELGAETLQRTNLGGIVVGTGVNLEWSLRLGDRLGGHWVTGHIDGQGTLFQRVDDPPWAEFWFRVPTALIRQMASKGSIAVDGVSLTLVNVTDDAFSVMLIPHTLKTTRLGSLAIGDQVNLETDLLAKYVEQQLRYRQPSEPVHG
jgi:riboflavin synthase